MAAVQRATFVMEQHLGHRTFYLNLRRFIESMELETHWVEVTYAESGQAWDRTPVPHRLRAALRGRTQIRAGLAQADTDIVFFNTQVPAVIGAGASKRPYVVSTDITPIQYDRMAAQYAHPADDNRVVRFLKHLSNHAIMRGAARLLPWSSWARDSLLRDYGVNPERIEVLPPGVDIDTWSPRIRARGMDPVRFLFVGGDFWRKGGATVLDAFRALPRGSAELLLVTRSQVSASDGIHVFHHLNANTSELIELYRSADVFVLPSLGEAFGIAAMEALAVGLPVISSAVGGLTDIVADGESGFLIDPGDSVALASQMRALIDAPDLRARMGAAARRRAELRFDARRNAARLVAILGDVINERRSA